VSASFLHLEEEKALSKPLEFRKEKKASGKSSEVRKTKSGYEYGVGDLAIWRGVGEGGGKEKERKNESRHGWGIESEGGGKGRRCLSLLLSSPQSPGDEPGKEGVACSRKAGTQPPPPTSREGREMAEGAGKILDWLNENA
jgi:hypothetical protein